MLIKDQPGSVVVLVVSLSAKSLVNGLICIWFNILIVNLQIAKVDQATLCLLSTTKAWEKFDVDKGTKISITGHGVYFFPTYYMGIKPYPGGET